MELRNDLIGRVFGRLVVLYVFRHKGRQWCRCKCDCGGEAPIQVRYVESGHTSSCGCERRRIMALANKTHGKTKSLAYSCWRAMRRRCTDPNHVHYDLYGGRGIKVCPDWLLSFESFYADMADPPSIKHTLDRIECDGHYEKSNCRWATKKEQANKRRPRKLQTA